MSSSSSATLISLVLLSLLINSEACGINVYWGQDGREHSLKEACDTGYYTYVSVAFLTDFGCGRTPVMNLAGHCTPPCPSLSEEIAYCQKKHIKVLLSLGGAVGQHNLCSAQDAKKVADYLWTTFLAGTVSGPLGKVALDGVDFDIEGGAATNLYWDDLAKALSSYSTPQRKVYLSAAPQCFFPDYNLDTALKTGLFDYVWIQFYNNPPCDIRSGVTGVLASWKQWTTYLAKFSTKTQVFMGLPASKEAGNGYMETDQLIKDILPEIRKTASYGGIMLWKRYYDLQNSYSARVHDKVCTATRLSDQLISQVV